jgi:hypothetical protein
MRSISARCGVVPCLATLALLSACARYERTPLPPCAGRHLDQGWRIVAESLVTAGRLQGEVVNGATWAPLGWATVGLDSLARGVYADSVGRFRVDSLAPGSYAVTVRRIGYVPLRGVVTLPPERGLALRVWLDPEGGHECGETFLIRRKRWWEWP